MNFLSRIRPRWWICGVVEHATTRRIIHQASKLNTPRKLCFLLIVLVVLFWMPPHIFFGAHEPSRRFSINFSLRSLPRRYLNKEKSRGSQHTDKVSTAPQPNPSNRLENELLLADIEFYPNKVISGLGDKGRPALLPSSLWNESLKHFGENSFDSVLSDHISLNRHLKDNRGRM